MYKDGIPKTDSPRKHIEMAREIVFKIFQDFNPDEQLEFIRQIQGGLKTLHQEQFESAAKELEFRKSILNKFNENGSAIDGERGKEVVIPLDRIHEVLDRSDRIVNRTY